MDIPSFEEENQEQIPETLYRGITLKVDDFLKADLLNSPIYPGSDEIDKDGKRVVSDGNPYGVYMSDNRLMVATNYYGKSKESIQVPACRLDYGNLVVRTINMPSVGILFEISTNGLDVRKPEVSNVLKGVYNNGWEGDEYIVDEIPITNFQIRELCLSSEVYDRNKVTYKIQNPQDYELAKLDIKKRYGEYLKKVMEYKASLENLSDQERNNPRIVKPIFERVFV